MERVYDRGGKAERRTGMRLLINNIDALIPLGGAGLILAFPQWFTKKDLKAEENRILAQRLKLIGLGLLAAGALILIAELVRREA